MLLNEIGNKPDLKRLLHEHFGYNIPVDTMGEKQISTMLNITRRKIFEYKHSNNFHTSEKSPFYSRLLILEKLLNEADVASTVHKVHNVINPIATHAANLAGSTVGAFIHGLKGNAIPKNWGRMDASGNPLSRPSNFQEMNRYIDEIFKDKSFSELTPISRKKIKDYLLKNFKNHLVDNVEKINDTISKDPEFAPLNNEVKKEIVTKIYDAETFTNDTKKLSTDKTGIQNHRVPTKTEKDVVGALINQGMKKPTAIKAIEIALKKNPKLSNDFDKLFRAAIQPMKESVQLNMIKNVINERVNMKKTKVVETILKNRARKMLKEGEIENAQAALAAKDLVDRLSDTISELGKMSNDELPALIDAIRSSFGPDAATNYQNSATEVINSLLDTVKEKKTSLEQATLVLTGESSGEPTDLALPDDDENPVEDDLDDNELDNDEFGAPTRKKNPLGRETRIPADESLINLEKELLEAFNMPIIKNKKNINEANKILKAKIIAVNEALQKIDKKRKPLAAKRLAEALRGLVTEAIKKESKKTTAKKKKPADKSKADKPHAFDPGKEFPKNCKVCQGAKSRAIHQKK
jgi:hypothetical protein